MFPTFINKEYILTNLITLRFNDPHKGDVIVFKAPLDKDKDFIKRVMAIEGDTVNLKDGFVYVNDKKVDESKYLGSDVRTYGGSFLKDGQPVTVPQGEFLVMGDNRPFSSDSREWGFLKRDLIIGKSFFVYWGPDNPFKHMRLVKNPYSN